MACLNRFAYASLVFGFLVLLSGQVWAGGMVTYTDGSPEAGAQVIVTGGGRGKMVGAEGHFELGSIPDNSMIRIKTKDKDYAPLKLSASLFSSDNVAIVLQSKATKSKSLQ